MSEAGSRHLLFVVGMHRAGTSALCAALNACGASFSDNLLQPMAGVNDEGFWESAEVVALNEQLLGAAGFEWFSAPTDATALDWSEAQFDAVRQAARDVLARGFGEGKVQAVKDPRFCLTLAFWLSLCEDLRLPVSVCVIQRAPLEVAQSLCKRDEFPLGYGLRLYASYLRALLHALPEKTFWVSYEGLLSNPAASLAELCDVLPLDPPSPALNAALRADLRHQVAVADTLLQAAPSSTDKLDVFIDAVASSYPVDDTLADFARRLVARGRELTRIGNAHSEALATLDQRDADIGRLAQEHTGALETLNERDAQIVSLTRSLQEYDRTLREKDAHLQSLFSKPLIGLLFRALWKYETR